LPVKRAFLLQPLGLAFVEMFVGVGASRVDFRTNVIVIAATNVIAVTNRAEALDHALLQPDHKIHPLRIS
jgi:ATP-dependent Zn protease